ncbi:unnamed protein product [Ranitomeya imitator]|uniref:Uncharacterized protein n=1 Tax=Ranitomeya imitator TaxID=111125 RepID=A0ABN9LCX0_9NEOB|nr:unnamed protein product [Ranitomeya imitator]
MEDQGEEIFGPESRLLRLDRVEDRVLVVMAKLTSMLFSPSQTVLHAILSLTDYPPCYALAHTVLHVILSLTVCPPCYSLPHRLSSILSMLFSPSQTVLHVILSLTDCPSCYSLPHTVLHVILSLTDCPPCYSLLHRLFSMLFPPSQTVLHVILVLEYDGLERRKFGKKETDQKRVAVVQMRMNKSDSKSLSSFKGEKRSDSGDVYKMQVTLCALNFKVHCGSELPNHNSTGGPKY